MIKYCYTNQKYTTTTYNYDFKDYTHSLYEIVFNNSIVKLCLIKIDDIRMAIYYLNKYNCSIYGFHTDIDEINDLKDKYDTKINLMLGQNTKFNIIFNDYSTKVQNLIEVNNINEWKYYKIKNYYFGKNRLELNENFKQSFVQNTLGTKLIDDITTIINKNEFENTIKPKIKQSFVQNTLGTKLIDDITTIINKNEFENTIKPKIKLNIEFLLIIIVFILQTIILIQDL